MATENLVSINRVFSKVIRDFGLTTTNWTDSAIEWVAEGIKEIGTIVPYKDVPLTKTVNDYKLLLPCDFTLFKGVVDKDGCNIPRLTKAVDTVRKFEDRTKVPAGTYKHYTVNANYLNFSFTGEEVTMLYTDFTLDDDGYPMIVNTADNLTALSWKIMYHYLLAGNPHPNLNWQLAYQMWIKYRDKASNEMLFPSPEEMETVMAGWLSSIPNYNLNH